MKIHKIMPIIAIKIFIPFTDTFAAIATNQENGMICINSLQCQSSACVQPGGSNGLNYCVPKAPQGEVCSPKNLYGVYNYPPCERGLTCTQIDILQDQTNIGVCVDSGQDCETCDTWIHVGTSSRCTGYEEYLHGKCDSECGQWDSLYRCAAGYYGISHSDIVGTVPPACPTACKPCPEHGVCNEGYNETFYCAFGYYKIGDKCLQCPEIGVDSGGTTRYGNTPKSMLHESGPQTCFAISGTYTDTTGTFELSDTCTYTE